jgi:hypothetical protein
VVPPSQSDSSVPESEPREPAPHQPPDQPPTGGKPSLRRVK